MNLQHLATVQQLQSDRSAQLQSLRRPRRERRRIHLPNPAALFHRPLHRVPTVGNVPVGS